MKTELVIVFLLGYTYLARTDDQFLCCMKGIKSIRNIVVCPAPCCYGYEERTVYASLISQIIFCEKAKDQGTENFKDNPSVYILSHGD